MPNTKNLEGQISGNPSIELESFSNSVDNANNLANF